MHADDMQPEVRLGHDEAAVEEAAACLERIGEGRNVLPAFEGVAAQDGVAVMPLVVDGVFSAPLTFPSLSLPPSPPSPLSTFLFFSPFHYHIFTLHVYSFLFHSCSSTSFSSPLCSSPYSSFFPPAFTFQDFPLPYILPLFISPCLLSISFFLLVLFLVCSTSPSLPFPFLFYTLSPYLHSSFVWPILPYTSSPLLPVLLFFSSFLPYPPLTFSTLPSPFCLPPLPSLMLITTSYHQNSCLYHFVFLFSLFISFSFSSSFPL